jgi:glucose-1-phosphate thymidylyltransferase
VTGVVEKPADPSSPFVTTRCYVLPEDILRDCALLRPSAERKYQLSEAVGVLVRAGYEVGDSSALKRVNMNAPEDVERASGLVE